MLHDKKIRGSYSSGEVEGDGADEDVSIERILAAGLSRGLRMQDTESLTMGMWIDYIIEWNNMTGADVSTSEGSSKPKAKNREATQTDFDNF